MALKISKTKRDVEGKSKVDSSSVTMETPLLWFLEGVVQSLKKNIKIGLW